MIDAPFAGEFEGVGVVGNGFLKNGIKVEIDEIELLKFTGRIGIEKCGVGVDQDVSTEIWNVVRADYSSVEPVDKLFRG